YLASVPHGSDVNVALRSRAQATAPNQIQVIRHSRGPPYPRNTIAGSRLRIFRMPSDAASQQMNRIAASVISGSGQGRKNGGMPFLRSAIPNSIASPTPQP